MINFKPKKRVPKLSLRWCINAGNLIHKKARAGAFPSLPDLMVLVIVSKMYYHNASYHNLKADSDISFLFQLMKRIHTKIKALYSQSV